MSLTKPRGKRALDKILADSFTEDMTTISLVDLRERRLQVDHEEAWLSYLRRMLHGRIDILEANIAMRRDGREETGRGLDVAALVNSLATQMGPGNHAAVGIDVVDSPGAGRRAVERLIARAGLDEYSTMSDAELDSRLDELRDMEREVSQVRHRIHEVHGELTAELARRYRTGEATPESVLKAES